MLDTVPLAHLFPANWSTAGASPVRWLPDLHISARYELRFLTYHLWFEIECSAVFGETGSEKDRKSIVPIARPGYLEPNCDNHANACPDAGRSIKFIREGEDKRQFLKFIYLYGIAWVLNLWWSNDSRCVPERWVPRARMDSSRVQGAVLEISLNSMKYRNLENIVVP